jgi:Zn-dependent membrane protease YugP
MSNAGLEVGVDRVPGQLTDFYDPRRKAIFLSDASQQPSVAAMAIVAHELGHAQQDLAGNAMMQFRSSLAPAAQLGPQIGVLMIFAGLWLQIQQLATVGLLLFGGFVLFTLVTLPVEIDASRRARKFLHDYNLVSTREAEGVGQVLNAAALTYVAGLATAILQLVHFASLVSDRRR